MSTVTFGSLGARSHHSTSRSNHLPSVIMPLENTSDRRLSNANESNSLTTTLLLRKLPRNTTNEAVRTMLLFAKDLQDTEVVTTDLQEDNGFTTAIARFSSVAAALEAQTMLDGKSNTAGQANMVVEVISAPPLGNSGRRNTMDHGATRGVGQSLSPPPPHVQKSSRFNGTFQTIDKIASPVIRSSPDSSNPDSASHMQSIFAPQSPANHNLNDRSRKTGKSVIGEDGGDDETGELLKDPLAYMNHGGPGGMQPGSRQQVNLRAPTNAFNALTLNTSMNATPSPGYASPRSAMNAHNQSNAFSPGGHPYQMGGNHFLRHNFPPANPADQNPPCNTLYVGNLPMDTSEDELKAMFSKQRGYKRLCFRTKQNGPMCFVEFEDVSFATKALSELYGAQLHNSVKGGIRLSFSKNPLGVRSGQPGGGGSSGGGGGSTNVSTPLSATGPGVMNGFSPMSPGAFSTANGPPPGLSAPPGLNMGGSLSPGIPNGQFPTQGFPMGTPPLHGGRVSMSSNASNGSHLNGMYPDYMMGR